MIIVAIILERETFKVLKNYIGYVHAVMIRVL